MVFEAMYEGIKHIFKRTFTMKYPYQKFQVPKGYRGRHILYMEKCTGCGICAWICPERCISFVHRPIRRNMPRTLRTVFHSTGTPAVVSATSAPITARRVRWITHLTMSWQSTTVTFFSGARNVWLQYRLTSAPTTPCFTETKEAWA